MLIILGVCVCAGNTVSENAAMRATMRAALPLHVPDLHWP